MGITIKELSELSGYSCSTISRVITNKGNVKDETREAVEKLLTEHNYRTSIMEIREAELNKKTIMIIVGDLDNWYYMELIRVIKQKVEEKGYVTIIAYSSNHIEEEEQYVRMTLKAKYAGIIFTNVRGGEKLSHMITESNIPVVFLNRGIKFASFNLVSTNNYLGGYLATEYLIKHGHKKIGHLAGSMYSNTTQERKRGFEDAMRDNKLVVSDHSIYYGDLDSESGYIYGEKMIIRGLDYSAIFCGNYLMALGLMDALKTYGVRVPDDLSLICYDDTPLAKREGISTVSAEPQKMGKAAAELLISNIEEHKEEKTVLYRPQIIERNSVRTI